MKNITNKYLGFLFAAATLVVSCEDLEVENLNQPDAQRALSSDSDIISLIDGSVTDTFSNLINLPSAYFDFMADQISTTNAYLDFWGFADQPRRAINNSTTNSNLYPVSSPWGAYNQSIYNANVVLRLVNVDERTISDDGADVTAAKKATALFVRGISLGTIGMIYDKGYRVDENTDLGALEFEDYSALIGYALADIGAAIDAAPSDFEFQIYDGYTIDRATFVKVANSFRAKIAMGVKRGGAGDETINYAQVISWLDAGITEDFDPPASNGVLYNNGQDWMTYTLSDDSGYMPVDQKIAFLVQGDESVQPKDYPTDASVILGPITNTTDSRIANYFAYTTNFGYLRESRGRHLFSNYRHTRFFTGNNRNQDGLSTNIFSKAEANYLKAEAQLLNGDTAGALATINASAERAASGLPAATNAAAALLYEYSIELHLNGTIGTNHFFMRRHNLLQAGTPLHYPVPAGELEISGLDPYTFGGPGGDAAASGPGWK